MLIFACIVSVDEAMNVAVVYKADDYILCWVPCILLSLYKANNLVT